MNSQPIFKQQFYLTMGQCISAWAFVEHALFELCHAAIGCKKERAAIIFDRIPTLEARFALVNELMLSILPKKDRANGGHNHNDTKAWMNLVREAKGLLPIRNMMAHRPVSRTIYFDPRKGRDAMYQALDSLEVGESLFVAYEPVDDEMVISAPMHSRFVKNEKTDQSLKIADLQLHLEKVRALSKQLHAMIKPTRARVRKASSRAKRR